MSKERSYSALRGQVAVVVNPVNLREPEGRWKLELALAPAAWVFDSRSTYGSEREARRAAEEIVSTLDAVGGRI